MRLQVWYALLPPSACSCPAAFRGGFSHIQDFREGKAKDLHEDEAKDNTAGNFPSLWQPVPVLQQAMLRKAGFQHR